MRQLKQWTIVPTGVSSMAIEGYSVKTGKFRVTKDVQLRLGNYRVVTVDGVCYELRGQFDRDSSIASNLPLHIINQFENGIPLNWKRIIYGWPTTAAVELSRSVERPPGPTSGRHGSSTTTRPVSVPGTPPSDSSRKYNPSGEELRSVPRIAPERGETSGSHVADATQQKQPLLKNLVVLLRRLPVPASCKRNVTKFVDERIHITQVHSPAVSVEKRSTSLSSGGRKRVAEQTAMSSPKRLARNRIEPAIYSEAKALSAKEAVKKRSSTVQGRQRTRSMASTDNNARSRGKKENEAVQAKKRDTNSLRSCSARARRQTSKDEQGQQQRVSSVSRSSQHPKLPQGVEPRKTRAQTSQPNQVSTSAATKASLATAKKGTLKQKVQTSQNKGTKRRDTHAVQKRPVSACIKKQSSKMQASNRSVGSVVAIKDQLKKADKKQTPRRALDITPIPNMAKGRYLTRKSAQSMARTDLAKAGHASRATATQLLDALSPKMPNSTRIKRKRGASAEKPDPSTSRKKPKVEGKVRKPTARPRAVRMGGPRRASSTAVQSRKQAGTSKLSHPLKTTERVLAAEARKEALSCKARVGERNSAKECHTSITERPETRRPPARSCRRATARESLRLDQKAGSSNRPANIPNLGTPSESAATEKPNEGDGGQEQVRLQHLRTSQTSDGQQSKPTQKPRSSKTRACTVNVGHATQANATPKDRTMALRRKLGSRTRESHSLLGQKKPCGDDKGTEELAASTGRSKPQQANKAQKPSGNPEVGSGQHLKPTPIGLPRKKASKHRGQTVETGYTTKAVQQRTVQCRSRITVKNATEKQCIPPDQNKPQKTDKVHLSRESVDALERKTSGLTPARAKSRRLSDLGRGSKVMTRDQVLATTAQKGIPKQTGRTSGTENAKKTVQRKLKKGDKVQRQPASSNAKNVRELAAQAGPSRTPMVPRKGGKGRRQPASSGAERSGYEFTPKARPSRTPKPSVDTRFAVALPAVTGGKGTKKRKAHVKQLAEALAARGECDMYATTGAPLDVVGDIFDGDPWAQMSTLGASRMATPTPNSPHMSPGKRCGSVSSDLSAAGSASPPSAHAILRGLKGKKAPALPSSTPKLARKKHLSVSAWAKELKVLGEEMERDQIRVNCVDSGDEGSDTESSGSVELPALLL